MRFLLFSLFSLSAFAQAPTVTIAGTDNLSHSVVRVTFNSSAPISGVRVRYVVSPGTCTSGSGGTVEVVGSPIQTGMRTVIGGLTPATSYQICPEVTADGTTWSTGAGTSVTTQALPAIHPAPPIPPVTFDTSYPNTAGYTTIAETDCSTFQADLNAAIGNQLLHGTVITLPAGSTCTSGAPYQTSTASADTIGFAPSAVNTTLDRITLPSHGFTEGQTVVFGSSFSTLPVSTSCKDGSGFPVQGIVSGQLYPVHVVDANTIQIKCADGTGTTMDFTTQGTGANLYVRPEPDPRLNWVIVRTATPEGQFAPPGTRVTPAWLPKMASFVQPMNKYSNSTAQNSLLYVDNSDGNIALPISNIRFVGLEFTVADDSIDTATSTDPNFWWRMLYTYPWDQNVIFDRCYIHGRPRPSRNSEGMYWDGHNMAIIDSYFEHLEYWHPSYTGLTASGSGTSFTIAPGTFNMGTTSYTLVNPVTVHVLSGTTSGASFVYYDFSGKLTVTVPPGLQLGCTGCNLLQTYNEVNGANAVGDLFPTTAVANGNIYIDPVFSTASSGGAVTTLQPSPVAVGAPFATDGSGYARGTRFYSDSNGFIQGVRFYKDPSDVGAHTVSLWSNSGTRLAGPTSGTETASGWQSISFPAAVAITAGTHYMVSEYGSTGARYYSPGMFENGSFANPPLHAVTPYSANVGVCNTSSDWPRNAFSNPAAGEIACVNIASGSIASVQQGDATTSTYDTEGSNFLIGGLGPGPYEVLDTYIEGVGLAFHHDEGGGDARIRRDYTYNRDMFLLKPSHMYQTANSDGYYYAHRHLLEWKSGGRIAITGTQFDGATEEDTPIGDFLEFSSVNGGGTHDVLLQNDTFRHGPAGFFAPSNIESQQAPEGPPPVRFTVKNNLFWDIAEAYHSICCLGAGGGKGWIFTDGGNGEEDTVFDHNSVVQNTGVLPSLWVITNMLHEGVKFTNNFLYLTSGDWGFRTTNDASAVAACIGLTGKAAADCLFPVGYQFHHNVLMSNDTQANVQAQWQFAPLFNYFPASPGAAASFGFFNYDGSPAQFVSGNPKHYNFRLNSNYCSGCGQPAGDGIDVGANIDQLEAAQGKITLIGVPETSITSSSATVVFVCPDLSTCASVDYSISDPSLITSFTRVPISTPTPTRLNSVALTGLTSGTVYFYRVNGAVEQPQGRFRTR